MSNLNQDPQEWAEELFEYEYCGECGGDAKDHDIIPFLGNWFARCRVYDDALLDRAMYMMQVRPLSEPSMFACMIDPLFNANPKVLAAVQESIDDFRSR